MAARAIALPPVTKSHARRTSGGNVSSDHAGRRGAGRSRTAGGGGGGRRPVAVARDRQLRQVQLGHRRAVGHALDPLRALLQLGHAVRQRGQPVAVAQPQRRQRARDDAHGPHVADLRQQGAERAEQDEEDGVLHGRKLGRR